MPQELLQISQVSATLFVASAQARDPIPAFRKFALEEGLMSDADVKDIEKQVTAEVEEAVKFADESPKPVSFIMLTISGLFLTC